MPAKLFLFVLIGLVQLLNGDWADAKPPQVLRDHFRWPESQYSYLVQELNRKGFVMNGEFVKSKIDDHFANWRRRDNLDKVIEGLKQCADEVIAKGRSGDLDQYILCVDNNEKVGLLDPSN